MSETRKEALAKLQHAMKRCQDAIDIGKDMDASLARMVDRSLAAEARERALRQACAQIARDLRSEHHSVRLAATERLEKLAQEPRP